MDLPYPPDTNGEERAGTNWFPLILHSWVISVQIEAIRSWVASYTIPSTAPWHANIITVRLSAVENIVRSSKAHVV